jgi:hypothetical protein
MTEAASHEKLTRTPTRRVTALIETRWRFGKVITEIWLRIKAGSHCAYVGENTRGYGMCARRNLQAGIGKYRPFSRFSCLRTPKSGQMIVNQD